MLGFALLAYYDYQKNQTINSGVIIYLDLALLFQPPDLSDLVRSKDIGNDME